MRRGHFVRPELSWLLPLEPPTCMSRLEGDMTFGNDLIANASSADIREWTDTLEDKVSSDDTFYDWKVDHKIREDWMNSPLGQRLLESTKRTLTASPHERQRDCFNDHLLLLPLRLYGYALSRRKWFALNINNLSNITHDKADDLDGPTKSFEDLVLPEAHKMLVKALIKNQIRGTTASDPLKPDLQAGDAPQSPTTQSAAMDLIRGKGRGLILLLHGVPGVGKTSTVESVAAHLGRPLFPITCGDLGTDAASVESKLDEYFALAQKWKCVLLLDEADVFLATRVGGDLVRNGLVSGVLVLTTNRVGEFDEAFRSRIHVSIEYKRLDEESTNSIWEVNLARIKDNAALNMTVNEAEIRAFWQNLWSEDDHEKYPERRWNGRQIKNAFQTAVALANYDFHDHDRPPGQEKAILKASHFKYIAKANTEFDNYLNETMQGTYSQQAAERRLRQDDRANYSSSTMRGPRSSTRAAPSASAPDNATEVQALKRQLRLLDKNKRLSQEARDKWSWEIQTKLIALGVPDDEILSESEAGSGAQDSEKRAPWS